jgi:hypothetical protein
VYRALQAGRRSCTLNQGRPFIEIHQERPPTRASDAIVLCGEENMRSSVIEEAGDDYVLVGSIPCRLSSKVHIDGRRIIGQHASATGHQMMVHKCVGEANLKQARVMSAEGHEVIGSGYSDLMNMNQHTDRHDGFAGTEGKKMITRHAWEGSEGQKDLGGNLAQEYNCENSLLVWLEGKMSDSIARVNLMKVPEPRWCPGGLSKTQRWRLQKMRQTEIEEKQREEECDLWFNQVRPMVKVKQTLREKRLAKEEGESSSSGSEDGQGRQEKEVETRDPASTVAVDVNMVFVIPKEFHARQRRSQ